MKVLESTFIQVKWAYKAKSSFGREQESGDKII